MTISDWQVMHSNAGYYVGREVNGVQYDRRSGYFKTDDEAEQELCSYSGHFEENGKCSKCGVLMYKGKWINSSKGKKPTAIVKELKQMYLSHNEICQLVESAKAVVPEGITAKSEIYKYIAKAIAN